jgi:hypothetical protein
MRRILDVLIIAAVLGAIGFGAWKLGHRVDSTSNDLAKSDSELTQPASRPASHHGPSRQTVEIVIVAVAGAAAVMLLVSTGGAVARRRRRQRWRAT